MGPNDALKTHGFTHILWYYGVPVITMGVPVITMGVPIPLPIWVRCLQVRVQVWEKKPEGHPCHALGVVLAIWVLDTAVVIVSQGVAAGVVVGCGMAVARDHRRHEVGAQGVSRGAVV